MKILNNLLVIFLLPVYLSMSQNVSAQTYPEIDAAHGLFICEPLDPSAKSYYSSISYSNKTFDGTVFSFEFPQSLTPYLGDVDCPYILTNGWHGDRIAINLALNRMEYTYKPIRKVASGKYELSGEMKLKLPKTLNLGDYFSLFPSIDGEVISEEVLIWNSYEITNYKIKVTTFNPNHNWTEGEIIVSKEMGIMKFPNLQFFPFEWRNCTRVSREFNEDDLLLPDEVFYKMEKWDQYTTEKKYALPISNLVHEFTRNTCIKVPDNKEEYQVRVLDREKIKFNPQVFAWEYSRDTIT